MPVTWDDYEAVDEPKADINWSEFEAAPEPVKAPDPAQLAAQIQRATAMAGGGQIAMPGYTGPSALSALPVIGKQAVAGLADIGEAITPGGEPGVYWRNSKALAAGEPLPAETERKFLPKPLQIPESVAQGLVGSMPSMATVAGLEMVGVPAPLGAAMVFGQTEHGFDPKQAAVAAALPFVGKYSGEFTGAIAEKLGVNTARAMNIIKGLGGMAGVIGFVGTDETSRIATLPENERKDAWIEAAANAVSMAALGPMGVKFETPEMAQTRISRRPGSLQGPPAPGVLLRLPEGAAPPRIEPPPGLELAMPAEEAAPKPTPPTAPTAPAAEPVPTSETAVATFVKALDDPTVRMTTEKATEAGTKAQNVADLDALLAQHRKILTVLKAKGDIKGRMAAGANIQYPREAIEAATNSGSHIEGEGTIPTKLGPRPLDWTKNPEVENWLRANGDEIGIKLPASKNPEVTAKEIGFEFKPVSAFKTEGIPQDKLADLERIRNQTGWEFTDTRPNSPTKAITFYTPIGASPELIRYFHQKKLAQLKAGGENITEIKPSPAAAPSPLATTKGIESGANGGKSGANVDIEAAKGGSLAAESSQPVANPPAGPISQGPGAASPGDVPPEPPVTEPVMSRSPEQRPNGIVTPSSPGLFGMLGALPGKLMTFLRGAAGDTMPKTTAADRATGEAGAEYLSSHIYAPRGARVFSTQVLQGTDIDPGKFGAALVEDNLRSIREGFRAEATDARARGNPAAADAATAKADKVTSLIGHKNSPFPTEDAYQDFLADPNTKAALERHRQQWEEVVDPMFKKAQSIDPNEELPSRGQQTGARVNLKAILEGDTGTRVVRSGPSLTATFKRKSPFARAAKGTGTAYEVDYHELMSNTFTRQTEIANKNAFDKALVASGNAVIDKPGQQVEIKGERGVPFPLTRRLVIGNGEPIPLAQNIYVRSSLAREYRTAANVDTGSHLSVVTPVMNALNKAALAGLTDFTIHVSNQITALFNRPVSGGLLNDSLLSTFGRADVPVVFARALIKSFQNNEAQLTELAKIGALRETYKSGNPLGKILSKTDQVTRLLLDDTYQRLVKAGIAEDTPTARREYANSIGQYNKRAQGMLMRFLRDTGFGPFATAGRTFNAMGVKMATLSPGVKATNNFAAAALRLNVLSKWVGVATLLGTLNYLLTKDKGGGLMGRPGVPVGNLDTGRNDKNGKPLSLPLADIMGVGRAARVTGIKGVLNAKRLGLTDTDALDAAARDIINSAIGPAMGPGPRAAVVSATGSPPAVGVPRSAPVAPPGKSQLKVNVEEALKDANPIVKSFMDYHSGAKTAREALGQQLPRFTLQSGKTEAVAAKYPQIVNKAQLNDYAQYLAGEARKVPLRERYRWVLNRLKEDELNPVNAAQAQILLRRKGVFQYQ